MKSERKAKKKSLISTQREIPTQEVSCTFFLRRQLFSHDSQGITVSTGIGKGDFAVHFLSRNSL